VLKRYKKDILPKKALSTQAIEAVYLKRMGDDPIASLSIFHITPGDVNAFVHGLTKCQENKNKGQPLSDKSKRHYAGLLSNVFNTAIRKWGHQITNPVVMEDAPSPGKSRRRRLENDEETRLLTQVRVSRNPWLLPFVIMAIETGSRRGELFKLDWKNVKLSSDFGSALLVDTKNGDDRMIPLSADCVEILSTLPRPEAGGRVFPIKSVRTAWEGACQRAGITDFHVHDLRHESISRLFELGLNVIEVASVSGHKTLSILQDYTHLHPQKLARKINRAKLAA
jgi:integrase